MPTDIPPGFRNFPKANFPADKFPSEKVPEHVQKRFGFGEPETQSITLPVNTIWDIETGATAPSTEGAFWQLFGSEFDLGVFMTLESADNQGDPDVVHLQDGRGGAETAFIMNGSPADVTAEQIANAEWFDGMGWSTGGDNVLAVKLSGGDVYLLSNFSVDVTGGPVTFDYVLFGA